MLGSVYTKYEEQSYYYELVLILRRTVFACIAVLIDKSITQNMIAQFVIALQVLGRHSCTAGCIEGCAADCTDCEVL